MLAADLPPLEIVCDRGGMLAAYDALAREIARTGRRVRITRCCMSACTLLLTLPRELICAEERAEFWFHAASQTDPGTLRRSASAQWTAWTMRRYPPPVRAWLDSRGGLKPTWTVLRGAEMRALVPGCH